MPDYKTKMYEIRQQIALLKEKEKELDKKITTKEKQRRIKQISDFGNTLEKIYKEIYGTKLWVPDNEKVIETIKNALYKLFKYYKDKSLTFPPVGDNVTIISMSPTKNNQTISRLGEKTPSLSTSKKELVSDWQAAHPNGTREDCMKETGISAPTVRKWWKS